MGRVVCNIAISLDGFAAGPNQSFDNPIGEGGMRLHEWIFATAAWHAREGEAGGEEGVDSKVVAGNGSNTGAYVMGRNMFSAGRGEWDPDWRGWWGENPPYHVPVFVLTHHPRERIPMEGGTTFNFVTEGVHRALQLAQAEAGDRDVQVAGGASTVRQFVKAGLLDELTLHLVPIVLGAGERLLEDVGDPVLEPVEVLASPRVTHITYRLGARR